MMSEEISRVMTDQRQLEQEYGELIQRRGQLKGISQKAEYAKTVEKIEDVAKRLKESTRTLCRVLKDNPDVDGNQKKIRDDREYLIQSLKDLSEEVKDLSYSKFKTQFLHSEREKQSELKQLRDEEKELMTEIRKAQEQYTELDNTRKNSQEENEAEITKLKTYLNDARTDSELLTNYLQDEYYGKEDCQRRGFDQIETGLNDEIDRLKTQIEKENRVFQ